MYRLGNIFFGLDLPDYFEGYDGLPDIKLLPANKAIYHKKKKEKWISIYTIRIRNMKGIEKINMQRTIDSLKNQVKNHEELFAEYYI